MTNKQSTAGSSKWENKRKLCNKICVELIRCIGSRQICKFDFPKDETSSGKFLFYGFNLFSSVRLRSIAALIRIVISQVHIYLTNWSFIFSKTKPHCKAAVCKLYPIIETPCTPVSMRSTNGWMDILNGNFFHLLTFPFIPLLWFPSKRDTVTIGRSFILSSSRESRESGRTNLPVFEGFSFRHGFFGSRGRDRCSSHVLLPAIDFVSRVRPFFLFFNG